MVYVIDEQAEKLLIQEQFSQAFQLFEKEIYPEENPVFCRVYDLFCVPDSEDHNCLGCNLWESADLIRSYLQMNSNLTNINQAYTLYIMVTYLFVSRIETILGLIGFENAHRHEKFKILQRIRRIANFLKHPKAMVLAHHPSYIYEGDPNLDVVKEMASVVVDESFISKFYAGIKNDSGLYDILQNEENAIIVFPNVIELTRKLCDVIFGFIELLENNEDYIEILGEKSTFLNYWAEVSDIDMA